MRIKVGNKIDLIDCPEDKKAKIKSTLTLSNPTFFKLRAMGKWVGGTSKEFKYYEEKDGIISIPRGMFTRLKRFLPDARVETALRSTKLSPTMPFKATIELRSYQDAILTHWRTQKPTEGVFALSTGSGKSILSLQIIKELYLTATILVPTNIILEQFREEMKKYWDYDCGIINGQEKIIKEITVASVASLFNNEKLLKELVANTSVLIVDECANFISDARAMVIEQFNPSYIYGLSGSIGLEREDGQSKAINFYFGNVIEEYEAVMVKPTVEIIDSMTFLPVTINYAEMVDKMIENKSRNTLIAGLALGEMLLGRKVLVLCKRIEHYKVIRQMLPVGDVIISADSDDDTLVGKLDALRKNEMDFQCILGTFSLLGTGFNIEKLDTLIIAGDLKSQILTTQSAGRILRLLKDKTAKIIDIFDSQNGIFRTQGYARQKLYKQKGWVIKTKWD